jgi:Fe-S cluster biogenesis protein NfuA/nitrite reductase/ring-hydroxylating ferredoxin subunit
VDDAQARDRVARIDQLLGDVEELPDPARALATELVQALLELYGEGLARVVAHLDGSASALAADEVVSHLLLLHGLHPVPLRARVQAALDEVAPYLGSHGGGVELVGVEDGVVRLRLEGSCNGCPSSTMTLKLAIEDAIQKAAPDAERIVAEGAAAPAPAPPLIGLEVAGAPRAEADGAWAGAGSMGELPGDAPVLRDVAGEMVLFVRLGRGAYAYRPACPHCGGSLAAGTLNGARLICGACGHRYDVRHAGRCVDAADLHMEPVPLLVDPAGAMKVALGAAA